MKAISYGLIHAIVILWISSAACGQAESSRLRKSLDKLQAAQGEFESVRESSVQSVLETIDEYLGQVDDADIPLNVKADITKSLREARHEFKERAEFAAIPALQPVFRSYLAENVQAYNALINAYQKTYKELPKGDQRREQFLAEVGDYEREAEAINPLREGKKYLGYRTDYDWGPAKRFEYSPTTGA